MRTRAIIYVRVSTAEQVENHSLSTQERLCREYCDQLGLVVDTVFREEGESAKTANRPQLQRLMEYCAKEAKRRDIGALVVVRVDRLARAVGDHAYVRGFLRGFGVVIRAVHENFDDSATGQFVENVMASFAQLDNDLRAARTREGMHEAVLQGQWLWKPPLGYRRPALRPPPSLVPDTSASMVVEAFERVASGEPVTSVWSLISVAGLRARSGKQLTRQAFRALLRNPIYVGRVVVPSWQVKTEGDFEPLVSVETFDAVQRALTHGPGKGRHHRLDHPDFPLRRVVLCGECGSPLTGSWSRGRSGRYAYYRCPRKGCGRSKMRREALEDLFMSFLESQTVRPEIVDLLAAVVADGHATQRRQVDSARSRVMEQAAKIERKRSRIVEAFVHEQAIDRDTYEREDDRLRVQEAELQTELNRLVPPRDLGSVLQFAKVVLSDLSGCWNRLDAQRRPAFARSLYPRGLVLDEDRIGTNYQPWSMQMKSAAETVDDGLAAPTALDWNQIEEWLSGLEELQATLGFGAAAAVSRGRRSTETQSPL